MERGLVWDKAYEIYKQYVKVEHEDSENHLSKCLPPDGFYISNQVILKLQSRLQIVNYFASFASKNKGQKQPPNSNTSCIVTSTLSYNGRCI